MIGKWASAVISAVAAPVYFLSLPAAALQIDLSSRPGFPAGDWRFELNRSNGLGDVTGFDAPAPSYWIPPSIPNTADASWLKIPFTGFAYYQYSTMLTYKIEFLLTNIDLATVDLTGEWGFVGTDVGMPVTLMLNGVAIDSMPQGTGVFPTTLDSFSTLPSQFVAGLNVLSIEVPLSKDSYADSNVFRLEGILTAASIPEPSSTVLFLAAIGLLSRVRRSDTAHAYYA